MTTATAIAPFTTYSLSDLEALKFPPIEWVVDDLLPAGALVLVVGRPKAGKSLLAIDLAASVVAGDTFLDRATDQGPAVYVPAEDALRLVRSRIFTRLPSEREIPLYVLPADGYDDQAIRIDHAGSFARLAGTIERIEPALVILDPFRELHQRKENDADEMAGLLRPLRQLAHEIGVCIVLIHHRNKHASDPSLATRGSSAISGGVDAIITLDTPGGDDEEFSPDHILTMTVEGRYGPKQRLAARLRAGLRWESTDPRASTDAGTAERIVRYLESTGERLTGDGLAEQLELNKKTIQNALSTLHAKRRVVRISSGTKSDPYRYMTPQNPRGNHAGNQSSAPESTEHRMIPGHQKYIGESPGIIFLNGAARCSQCGDNLPDGDIERGICQACFAPEELPV